MRNIKNNKLNLFKYLSYIIYHLALDKHHYLNIHQDR